MVSWQRGTVLSFIQVPSNLTLLADADYELSDDAVSLETLFKVQRFAVIAADYVGKGPLGNVAIETQISKEADHQPPESALTRELPIVPTAPALPMW